METGPAMEMHDRRLAISKASTKIVKTTAAAAAFSSAAAAATAAPPSSSSASGRPVPKVVNTDPSSFRRVVQELTGTGVHTTSSQLPLPLSSAASATSQLNRSSRLQRIAPPPLQRYPSLSVPPPPLPLINHNYSHQQQQQEQQYQQHQQEQQYQQHQQHQQYLVGQYSAPFNNLINPNPNPNTNTNHNSSFINPNPSFSPKPYVPLLSPNPAFPTNFPMLSPNLLSPLPSFDNNNWTSPLDSITPNQTLPPLLTRPNLAQSQPSPPPPPPPPSSSSTSYGHPHFLMPSLPLSPSSTSASAGIWSSIWSPSSFLSPVTLSPGLFPPSPMGMPPHPQP